MSCSSVQRVASYWMALAFGSACMLASVAPAAQDSSSGKHCLWRITNAPAPFYLLGSVHALRPSDYHKTPVIEQAIAQSQQFFFEIDPKEHETFGKKLVEAAKYPHGVQIKERINPQDLCVFTKDNRQWPGHVATFASLGHRGFARAFPGIRKSQGAIRH
jgi:uncharacterized protein YbaP (TraB family)